MWLVEVFVDITDPRQADKIEHDRVQLMVVAINAVRVGADTFAEIELWVKEKLQWLRRSLSGEWSPTGSPEAVARPRLPQNPS